MTLKLDHTPVLVIRSPLCGTCWVGVDFDSDGMICPSCGTYWDRDAVDYTKGELTEEWEELPGEPISEEEAQDIALREEMRQREEFLERMRHR